ncbi:MAG: bifunctional adenosylcobinamide kinase/adenosylcobinamide-phosphate guanylyltransferase [Desulfuromonadales bacterium]
MKLSRIIFITGGARSGKSRFAEDTACRFGSRLGYLATAQAFDDEMRERIGTHQQRRGEQWTTTEEPYLPADALERLDGTYDAILVDCITIWLSNLLLKQDALSGCDEAALTAEVDGLVSTITSMKTPIILVSSEVGMGIVPESRLGRVFRDIAGLANQKLAACADEAWLVASGLPLKLK